MWLASTSRHAPVGRRALGRLPRATSSSPARPARSAELPLALSSRAYLLLFAGDLTAAAALIDESPGGHGGDRKQPGAVRRPGSGRLARRQAEAAALVETTIEEVTARGEGIGMTFAEWAKRRAVQRPRRLRAGDGRGAAGHCITRRSRLH